MKNNKKINLKIAGLTTVLTFAPNVAKVIFLAIGFVVLTRGFVITVLQLLIEIHKYLIQYKKLRKELKES